MGSRGHVVEIGRTAVGDSNGITSGAATVNVPATISGVVPAQAPFFAAIEDGTGNYESVLVQAIGAPAGGLTPWTIARGQEGTAAVAHGNGATISVGLTEVERARMLKTGRLQTIMIRGSGAQTTGQKSATAVPLPFPCLVVRAIIYLGTQPTGSSYILDVSKNGTADTFTGANRPTIAVSTSVSPVATAPPSAAATCAAGDWLQANVIQVGSTIAGSDLACLIEVLVL